MSLKTCLKKFGLSKHEAAIMRALVRGHQSNGRHEDEAARLAVKQRLKELQEEKASVHQQINAHHAQKTEAQAKVEEASKEAAHSPHNDKPLPTDAQHKAGNYPKGHVKLFGLDISIENPKGSVRSGVSNGTPWQLKMQNPYGYIRKTEGADGDHVDVYLGDHLTEDSPVFIVDQIDPETKRFDEHKVVLGARGFGEAKEIYDNNFSDDSAEKRRGAVVKMTLPEFKEWLKGDTTKPVKYKEPKPTGLLNDPDYRRELQAMAKEAGWSEIGGRLLRDTEGKVTGRTQWIPKVAWWTERPDKLNEQQVREAVRKALAGEPLKAAEQRTIDYMLKAAKANLAGEHANIVPSDEFTNDELSSSGVDDLPPEEAVQAMELAEIESPDNWATMNDGEKDAYLDQIFGETSRAQSGAEAGAAEARPLELTGETEAEIKAREAAQAATAQKPEAPQPEEFNLSGSNRPADQAIAQGQRELAPISDFGEKIGGARKDTSQPTGSRVSAAEQTSEPGWRKRFHVYEIASSMRPEEVGRFAISDTRVKGWRGERVGRETFPTREAAEEAVPLLAVAQKHRVYMGRPNAEGKSQYAIWREVTDRKRVQVVPQEFSTREDAMRYMADHAAEILETKTSFGEEILAKPDTVKRIGIERRAGQATKEMFGDTFGFRGVEFGNWNNQEERQEVMNHAFDGLLDLAEVLGIPPRAISLNGELALAFGARGQGLSGAKAHYERDYGVINLTKMTGAGSLAHEWFHALDHYLARQDTKSKSEKIRNESGDMVYEASTPKYDFASHGFRTVDSKVREELRKVYTDLIQTMFTKAEQYVEDTQRAEKFVGASRNEVAKSLAEIRTNLTRGPEQLTYMTRNNKPASAEQLAKFDQLADKLVSGEDIATAYRPSPQAAGKKVGAPGWMAGRFSNDTLEEISAILKSVRGRSGFSADKNGPLDGLRANISNYEQRIKMLKSASAGEEKTKRVPTSYAMENKKIDQGRASDYWTTEHEMAARAFSAYVEDKIAEQGNRSDFLAYGADNNLPQYRMFNVRPFPEGKERVEINKAFDKFVGALKTKETDKGVALFSRGEVGQSEFPINEANREKTQAGNLPDNVAANDRADQGIPRETLDRIVSRVRESFPGAAEVETLGSTSDAPRGLIDHIKRVGGEESVQAAWWNGKVYAFAENLGSEKDAEFAILHEFGHDGLRKLFGPGLDPILRSVYDGSVKVQLEVAKLRRQFPDLSVTQATEEYLANVAGSGQRPSWLSKVIAYARDFLRAKGFVSTFSDNDILNIMEGARGALTRRPDFVPAGVMFSRTHLGTLSPAQEAALRNVHGDPVTWQSKLAQFKTDWKKNLIQGVFDQYAPIMDYTQKGYRLARQAKAGDSTLEALLLYGKVSVDSDGAYRVAYSHQTGMNGFAKVIGALHGEQDRFLEWVAAQRAERLASVGLENLYSPQDIVTLKTLNQGFMKDGGDRPVAYARALRELNDWNDSVLKIASDSGLIDEETRLMYKDMPYVPFYRLQEDNPGFGMKAGLVNQTAWKKLKGGTAHLNDDLLANLLQNWSHLITASSKNRAAKETLQAAKAAGVAAEVPSGTPGKGLVSYRENGQEKVFRVEDPHLMDAIAAMHYTGLGDVGKPFITMKRWLTTGVTANPAFKIRNLIRDSIQAIGTADLSYNPLKNIKQGFKGTREDSEIRAQLLAGGGMIRFGSMLDGNNADRTRRLIEQGVDPQYILDDASKIEKLWKQKLLPAFEAYQELGDRGEQISRAALYEQLLAKGMTHEEAAFWARDLMDFSLSGKWAAVRILTQVVPFMNARLQGLYKIGRATKADYRRMGTTLGAGALSSMALLLAYKDDDDWKKREDFDRDNFWWFKVGDLAIRLPKPFEVGAIGTLAERSLEYFISDEMTGARFAERVSATIFNQLSMNPTPQLVKPLMDLYANKDSFTGRPIETMGMERLRKGDRSTERTSEIAKALGQLGLPDPTQLAMGQWNTLSPVQIDSLVKGYLGWIGTSATTMLDWGIRPLMDRGQRPDMKLKDVFLAGNFVETLPTNSSRYVTQLYDQANAIEQAFGSYHDALKRGDTGKAASILEDEGEKIAKYKVIETIKRGESQINAQIRAIEASKTIDGDKKRERIDRLNSAKDSLAKLLAVTK